MHTVPPSRFRTPIHFGAAVLCLVFFVADAQAGSGGPRRPARAPSVTVSSFTATAYCTGTVTAMGTRPKERIVAADPSFLPMGSRIRLAGLDERYSGVYTVMDTGARIRGRRVDLYMRNCHEAVRFGRRPARVSLLR